MLREIEYCSQHQGYDRRELHQNRRAGQPGPVFQELSLSSYIFRQILLQVDPVGDRHLIEDLLDQKLDLQFLPASLTGVIVFKKLPQGCIVQSVIQKRGDQTGEFRTFHDFSS